MVPFFFFEREYVFSCMHVYVHVCVCVSFHERARLGECMCVIVYECVYTCFDILGMCTMISYPSSCAYDCTWVACSCDLGRERISCVFVLELFIYTCIH